MEPIEDDQDTYHRPPSLSQSSSFSVENDISEWAAFAPSQLFRPAAEPKDATNVEGPSLSQHSSFSELGGVDDISDLIRIAPTQMVQAALPDQQRATSFARTDSASSSGSGSSTDSKWSNATSLTSVESTTTLPIASTSAVKLETVRRNNAATEPEIDPRKRKFSVFSESNPKPAKKPRLPEVDDPDAPFIIAHSPALHRAMSTLDLPYGVQFEINRFTKRPGYELKEPLEVLKAKNNTQAASLIPGLFGQSETAAQDAFAKEIAAKAPWTELDLEDRYLNVNPLAGLGHFSETKDWFGGKIDFKGTIHQGYKIVLKPPELSTSNRFARRFGSARFLTLTIDKKMINEGQRMIDFLCRPFVLCGYVFRAYDAKDNNVFLVATNEVVEGPDSRINPRRTIPGFLSLSEFLDWHNDITLDDKQTMAKWAARFALGRSNSIPILRLEADAIVKIPDLESASGSDMTDGAGLANKAALRLIYNRIEMDAWPTAVQVRVVGAKGLLVMDPEDTQETPKIWLRPSQIKVKHNLDELSSADPALLTIDLLRTAHCRTSCRLSIETIINLAENGVPTSVFLRLLESAMVNLITPLITWDGEDAMQNLWYAVARTGGVIPARLARQETVLARQKGYAEREVEEDDEEDDDNQPQSTAWWVDEISGCPSSLEETVLALLDSGFHPETCSVLRAKLGKVVDSCFNRYFESYRIDLPSGMSATAFIVPDQFGVLEEGEFFLKSTHFDFFTEDGLPTEVLCGDALITRYPCKTQKGRLVIGPGPDRAVSLTPFWASDNLVPDIQKWKAVDRPELRHLTDVIVLSTKGQRRAADFLSGGDYDGDKALVIWEPEMVANFRNAPLHYSEEPESVSKSFSPNNETVAQFFERTKDFTTEARLRAKQQYLLSAIRDPATVGQYSNWHLNAIYTLGYTHPDTIRLAYMFCKTLDGAKTGLRVLEPIYKADKKKFDKRPPAWKEGSNSKRGDETNMLNIQRDPKLGPFIMDELHKRKWHSMEWSRKLKEEVDAKFNQRKHMVDEDLTAPWLLFEATETARIQRQTADNAKIATLAKGAQNHEELKGMADELLARIESIPQSDLDLIKEHVQGVYKNHGARIDRKFTTMKIEKRQDTLRELSREFADGANKLSMDKDQALRIMASYAYWYDSEERKSKWSAWSRFPWDVAFRELCLIKTKAAKTTNLKPVASEFYNRFYLKAPKSRT